jgi:hypothetical protein
MSVGTNSNGQPVFVADRCTITGVVASISGSGKTATVTVTTDKADSINVKPSDCSVEVLGGPYCNMNIEWAKQKLEEAKGENWGTNEQCRVKCVG